MAARAFAFAATGMEPCFDFHISVARTDLMPVLIMTCLPLVFMAELNKVTGSSHPDLHES